MPDPILLVVAHADDEVIGAGAWLARLPDDQKPRVTIAYITDSAPENPWFAREAGFATRDEYAAARRSERDAALQIAGISPGQCRDFGFGDQQSFRNLVEITSRISKLVDELRPSVILTHPYEGGHPDHDSAAFAVRQAATAGNVQVREFTSYHAAPQGLETGRFLPFPGSPEHVLTLTEAERALKRSMFACHRTQARVLAWFDIAEERFRPAPDYDFTRPPHPGTLHYESLDWGITGEMWRAHAAEALELLAAGCTSCP
ncbi:MAG TPA: PIG-L deacetylase family protein [Bryobacteraceae bacterium]|jgi:LmbE family N-acetylglucosaminyl deacetylase|nr:PIG-L deacetylase family protein [Bryobacteraceae bacterium]